MLSETRIRTLERRRARVLSELASVGEMRAGSLTARFRRCGKASPARRRPPPTSLQPGLVGELQVADGEGGTHVRVLLAELMPADSAVTAGPDPGPGSGGRPVQ